MSTEKKAGKKKNPKMKMMVVETAKAAIMGGVMGFVLSYCMSYFLIGMPADELANAFNNGFSGAYSGLYGGLLGMIVYFWGTSRKEKKAAACKEAQGAQNDADDSDK